MQIKDRIAAEKKAAKELLAVGEENLSDEQFDELKAHVAEAKKLEGRLKAFQEANEACDALSDGPAPVEAKRAATLGDLFVTELKAADMSVYQAKKANFETSEFKAASDAHMTTGEGLKPFLETIDSGVFEHRRQLTVADLFAQGTMAGSTLKYPVFGKLEGNAGFTAEGAAAPQVHFPDPTWKQDSLHKLTEWWLVTDEMMEDLLYVVSEVNDHADFNLMLVEEDALLNGTGESEQIEGLNKRIVTKIGDDDAREVQDRIFHAKTKIFQDTGFNADALVISPADYEKLRLKKDANGQYYGGGFFLPAYGGTGVLTVEVTPWGLKTVVTPAVADGKCIVGAFKAGGKVIRKGGKRFKTSESHGNIFIEGKTACLISERIALQVKYPYAFVEVSTVEPVQSPATAASAKAAAKSKQ